MCALRICELFSVESTQVDDVFIGKVAVLFVGCEQQTCSPRNYVSKYFVNVWLHFEGKT